MPTVYISDTINIIIIINIITVITKNGAPVIILPCNYSHKHFPLSR